MSRSSAEVRLDRQGKVKIADFGLAKLLRAGLPTSSFTGSQQALGTPLYMAPEQLERPQQVGPSGGSLRSWGGGFTRFG